MTLRTTTLTTLAGWLLLVPLLLQGAEPAPAQITPAEITPVAKPQAPTSPAPAAVSPPSAAGLYPAYSSSPSYSDYNSTDLPLWLEDGRESAYDLLHEHLRIGVRYRQIDLKDDKRDVENSFLGSITELNSQSDYEPITWLTFGWLFNPYVGLQFTWEQLRAETRTEQVTASLNHSDGIVDLDGPGLMLLLRYPNKTRLIPSGGIGYAWLTSTFEHNPVWNNGFGGENRQVAYDTWVANGSPAWPNGGYQRTITLEDTTAVILYAELAFQITPRLDVHAFIESMEVEGVDLNYALSRYGYDFSSYQAEFPMSCTAYGVGLRWSF
ncbi:MAG: hypothetical protein R6X19_10615 [Kiritimatiellia bacterium]